MAHLIWKKRDSKNNNSTYQNEEIWWNKKRNTSGAENTLLKQLNKELQDKNKQLHELLEKYKEKVTDNQFSKNSFAEVTNETKIQIQPKKVPKIVVKISKYEQGEVLNTVKKYLVREKNIQTKNIYTKNKSEYS